MTLGADAADGLEISADRDALDAYVIALGRGGIAVRALEQRTRMLESLFLEITKAGRDVGAWVEPPREVPNLDTTPVAS